MEKVAHKTSEVAEAMSAPQAALYLGVHPATIRRWINSGQLPAVRLGERQFRVKRDDLDQMVKAA